MNTISISRAVNYNSFIKGLINRCRYVNGNALSKEDKQKIFDYILYNYSYFIPSNIHSAITIKSAKIILGLFTDRTDVLSYKTEIGEYVLSLNSARKLLSNLNEEELKVFAKIGDIYGTYEFNNWNYAEQKFYYIDKPEIISLKGTLIGGGGGGSGGLCGDNGKVNGTITVPAGDNGWYTRILINKTLSEKADASAHAGVGGAENKQYHEGNAPYEKAGKDGVNGARVSIDLPVYRGQYIHIVNGYGGSGSGGAAVKVNSNFNYTSGAPSGYNGGAGLERNSWVGEDACCGGGGGAGGIKYIDYHMITGNPGADAHSGPSGQLGAWNKATSWNKGRGGRGGWNNNMAWSSNAGSGNPGQPEQPNTIGAGGYKGRTAYRDDERVMASGGNAGNTGGFVVDDSCKDYLIMFKGGINK